MSESNLLKDRAAIVGIGATEFSKQSGRSELRLAVEATVAALDDAGLQPSEVDGMVTYTQDTNPEIEIARKLSDWDRKWHRPGAEKGVIKRGIGMGLHTWGGGGGPNNDVRITIHGDGSVLAQLGTQDMRVPISYALGWPSRIDGPAARLDFTNLSALTFEPPDSGRFPSLRLAREALVLGGFAPIVLNAANEVAVAAFLARRIGFLDIARIVEDVLAASGTLAGRVESVQQVQAADREARRRAEEAVQRHSLSN